MQDESQKNHFNFQTPLALLKICMYIVPIMTSSIQPFVQLASTLLGLGMSVNCRYHVIISNLLYRYIQSYTGCIIQGHIEPPIPIYSVLHRVYNPRSQWVHVKPWHIPRSPPRSIYLNPVRVKGIATTVALSHVWYSLNSIEYHSSNFYYLMSHSSHSEHISIHLIHVNV